MSGESQRGNWQPTKEYVRKYEQIMQNKPNFQKDQMNVSYFETKDYENKLNTTLGENKPNSKPNKANSPRARNERKLNFDKGLRKNLPPSRPEKQSQFKANFQEAKK